jgi:hypothetical protein
MDGRDLTVMVSVSVLVAQWPAAASVRRDQTTGNAGEFLTHDARHFERPQADAESTAACPQR